MVLRGGNSNVLLPSCLKEVYDEVERRERISNDIESGECLNLKEIRKMMSDKAVMIGRVGDVLCVKKKKKVGDDVIDDLNFQSVLVEKAVEDAVKKARMLTQKREVLKTEKKTDANNVISLIVHGRLKGYNALRRVLIENARQNC